MTLLNSKIKKMIRFAFIALCSGIVGCSEGKVLGVKFGGTSDSGGGNGLNNKVYESYIVNPMDLPAFKNHLSPVFENIKKLYGNPGFLTYKTWYIAPVEFANVSKDVLGVSFSKDSTEQLAIQTSREIWIQKDLFEKMSSDEQSDLLVHEYVMNMYFVKFLNLSDFCKISYSGAEQLGCIEAVRLNEALYPAEPLRALNTGDYQNIRRATAFMLEKGAIAAKEELDEVFKNNGFDYRIFKSKKGSVSYPPEPLSSAELSRMFEIGSLTHTLPSQCQFKSFQRTLACQIKTQATQIQIGGSLMPQLQISIESNNQILKQTNLFMGYTNYWATPFENPRTGEITSSITTLDGIPKKSQIGQKINSVLLIATAKTVVAKELQITGMAIKTFVYTHSIQNEGRDYCIFEALNPQNLEEDQLTLGNRPNDFTFLNFQMDFQTGFQMHCSE